MAEQSTPPAGGEQQKRQALHETIDELEALLKERALEAPAELAPPDDLDIPVLDDRVADIDPGLFAALPQNAIGESRNAAAAPARLDDQIKRILTQELQIVMDDLRASMTAQIHEVLQAGHKLAVAPDEPNDREPMSTEPEQNPAATAVPETLAKTYDPRGIEQKWYRFWEEHGYFAPDNSRPTSYAIALPPPNVTGSLHMGHGFQHTLMDALIRYHRMSGAATLWQCGTDHAGIATQMVVERNLAAAGIRRLDLGRERFLDAVWDWKAQSGGRITQQLRRMGSSMDWDRERFTLDEGLSRAVTEVFVRLYHEGLIYRGQRLVNWDPVLHTALSDLEVVAEEEQGKLWHIRYPLAAGGGYVVVATTRPETMLGDTAVAVHPEDERYQHLIGQQLRLPLADRLIPIIADDYVDPAFGSGCVKITPAHDFNDYEVGKRHGLPLINIFTIDASLNDQAPPAYRGLDRYEARRHIVADLALADLLARIDEHTLQVPRGDRSHAVVEPLLTDQWFVKAKPLAEPAIAAVEQGRVKFVPENWSKTYFEWMRNIEDWCISRQLWWGHRIPAWYDANGAIYVGRDEADARRRHGVPDDLPLRQDEDVLDTWFSSALWPFSTLGWPEQTPELQRFYPTDVLVTAFDIIFFWVARMIMMGLKVMGDVPFREVYIHGLVRDADGNKMSKSKGNILDPLDLVDGIELEALVAKRTTGLMRPEDAPRIEQVTRKQFPQGIPSHGTDALRFTFASLATQGRDIRFDLGRIDGYRNFCNKLWNAARFVLLMTEPHAEDSRSGDSALGLPERWIRGRMQQAIAAAREGLDGYRFDLAVQAIYEFVWDEFCDWYLELAKVDLNDVTRNAALQRGTRRVLVDMLETALRLLHPFVPFITEELWQRVAPIAGRDGDSIMTQPYPQPIKARQDPAAQETFNWLREAILGLRRIRAEMNIEPRKLLPVLYHGGDERERDWLKTHERYLRALARIETIAPVDPGAAPEAATALAGNMTFLIPLANVIDPAAERLRLDKEIDRLIKDRDRIGAKLERPEFVAKAPAEIVAKERQRHTELEQAVDRLTSQRDRIGRL